MTFISFLRLIGRHLSLMFITALTAGLLVFNLTKKEKKEFSTSAIVTTGLISTYNIEANNGTKTDYGLINNEMENIFSIIKTQDTREEVAARLLTKVLLLKEPDKEVCTPETFNRVQKLITDDVRQMVVVDTSFDLTLASVRAWAQREDDNPITKLVKSADAQFGSDGLENLKAKREGTSDMLKFENKNEDPAICRNAIVEIVNILKFKYRLAREGQSSDVLGFFAQATEEAAAALRGKEDSLLQFMVRNKIINYYEQTRFIAGKKEDLDGMYFGELMKLAAADSTRRTVEDQLSKRVNLPQLNMELLQYRNKLSDISTRMAQLEIKALDTLRSEDSRYKSDLQKEAERVKNDMRRSAESVFAYIRTPEGIEMKTLLGQWLSSWFEVEQTLARLRLIQIRQGDFEKTYSMFAPWGTSIKRIEREIELAEKMYLDYLHSYNTARLHKFSTLMSANIRFVDPPELPTTAAASKRMMLTIVAGLAGFIVVLVLVIALELLDGSLRDPENAAKKVGLELFTAFPKLRRNWEKDKKTDYALIMERAVEQLIQHIKIDLRRNARTYIARIAFMSTNEADGKTFVAYTLVDKFRESGNRVLYLRPEEKRPSWHRAHEDDRYYKITTALFDKEDEAELLPNENVSWHKYNYIITEMPPLINANYPAKMLNQMDISILVCRANRSWNVSDQRALKIVNQMTKNPCRLVLNATRVDLLESSLGEIPRRRSWLRRQLKKVAKRSWKSDSDAHEEPFFARLFKREEPRRRPPI